MELCLSCAKPLICGILVYLISWWHHQMETSSGLLALCAGNSLVTDEFPAQSPVTQSYEVFFDLCLNKWLSKQSWGWWFEMLSHTLWHRRNVSMYQDIGHTADINTWHPGRIYLNVLHIPFLKYFCQMGMSEFDSNHTLVSSYWHNKYCVNISLGNGLVQSRQTVITDGLVVSYKMV